MYPKQAYSFFFFNDTATTEIYTLSLHDALPISGASSPASGHRELRRGDHRADCPRQARDHPAHPDDVSQHAGNAEDPAADGEAEGALQGRSDGAPEGDDGALPPPPGEPAIGLPPDGPPAPDLRRAVQRAVARDRAPACAVRAVDQRPLGS